ncbi:MAG: hypothetical protein WDN00_03780 [Limisphaerales bacterium]
MKALLINGSRPVGDYSYNITNDVNFEGWGLPGLPTILPPGVTNQINKQCTSFFLDQDSTNALATGDRRTFTVTVDDTIFAQVLPLQVTPGLDGSAGQPRRRPQAGQQPGSGGHQPGHGRSLFRQ